MYIFVYVAQISHLVYRLSISIASVIHDTILGAKGQRSGSSNLIKPSHKMCYNCQMDYRTIFTALHAMQTRSSDENSVRLSVRLSVCPSHVCIVTKR